MLPCGGRLLKQCQLKRCQQCQFQLPSQNLSRKPSNRVLYSLVRVFEEGKAVACFPLYLNGTSVPLFTKRFDFVPSRCEKWLQLR